MEVGAVYKNTAIRFILFINHVLEMTTFVNYDGVVAKIVRPDIECTNGYIHLIDKVVVKVGYKSQSNCHQANDRI